MVEPVEQGTRTAARKAASSKAARDSAKIAPEAPQQAPTAVTPVAARKPVAVKSTEDGGKKIAAKSATKASQAKASAKSPEAPAKTPDVAVPQPEPVATPVEAPAPVAAAPEVTTSQPAKPEQPVAAKPQHAAPSSKKETRTMTTTPTTEYAEKFQTAIKDASEKAKAAFEKSQASFGEIGEFAKGNVEALVESTKILATGLQEMSKGYLAESKTTLETLTAEMKELAAAKTPSELLEKQSALLRKHFDAAVAASSKNSEAVLKLANEAFQPISTRVSLAVEKVKHAA